MKRYEQAQICHEARPSFFLTNIKVEPCLKHMFKLEIALKRVTNAHVELLAFFIYFFAHFFFKKRL